MPHLSQGWEDGGLHWLVHNSYFKNDDIWNPIMAGTKSIVLRTLEVMGVIDLTMNARKLATHGFLMDHTSRSQFLSFPTTDFSNSTFLK